MSVQAETEIKHPPTHTRIHTQTQKLYIALRETFTRASRHSSILMLRQFKDLVDKHTNPIKREGFDSN
ncbi:hypothetical protein EGR_08151 [Echinococcus granulosus]|uniref:Uncharacterized protein n=1 Tax=Echinococcus granulosus TaxID=6210 RepID=W6U749_ECHGR|nr:hypothetical protein EGR_08151 [Echinococcus granulosus]EUB57000.1 hypothetical protein EGR_08151 [Echinococcus granulosus]